MNPPPPEPSPALRSLLSPRLLQPSMLLWVMVLPQLVLLLLNFRSYGIVSGEMSEEQTARALLLALYGAALPLIALALVALRRTLHWGAALVLLGAHVGYLWTFTASLGKLLPSTVAPWMLPETQLLYHQYALVMPGLFYCALRLACLPSRTRPGWDAARSLLVAVLVPGFWYVGLRFLEAWRLFHRMHETVLFLLLVLSTLLVAFALLRLLVMVWNVSRRTRHGQMVLLTLAGLGLPLGGLLLNMRIPFPADFQSPAVYALAALNGLILLLPARKAGWVGGTVWLLQCAVFPFTLYFFLVFLPFLPLSLLAIIAMGTGFLILTPTVLFVLHVQRLREGWMRIATETGPRRLAAGALIAFALMPAWFVGSAALDRQAINRAIRHVYEGNYERGAFDGSRAAVKRSLEKLRDFKAGLQLPFLSEAYNGIVFGGLSLPDAKMDHLHRAFFGGPVEKREDAAWNSFFPGDHRRSLMPGLMRGPPPPTNTVHLLPVESQFGLEEDCHTLVATLRMENVAEEPAEFATALSIPPGVLVSGFWLDVAGERVPGRLFERKTALWVYETIRDMTRRDPGLLRYLRPGVAELRVFPFAAREIRTVWIEFLWPRDVVDEPIVIGDQRIALPQPERAALRYAEASGRGGWLMASIPWRAAQRAEPRERYLHAVVDRSALPVQPAAESLLAFAREHGIARCAVTFANVESAHAATGLEPLSELSGLLAREDLPAQGGFCRDRALKTALAWWREHAPEAVPVLVVLGGGGEPLADEDMAWYTSACPELTGYYSEQGGLLEAKGFDGGGRADALPLAAIPVGEEGPGVWLPADAAAAVMAPGASGAERVVNGRYAQGVRAWLEYQSLVQRPSRRDLDLADVVATSRESGVLVPATAYIVVENSAQWRMLELKEKQKLRQSAALEFRDAPEPSVWLLLPGLLIVLGLRRAWRSKRGQPVHCCNLFFNSTRTPSAAPSKSANAL